MENSMRLDAPIKELVFADGQRMPLEHDSIVVFVGPNNAGKTTCLRDIYSILSNEPHVGLVKEVDFIKPSYGEMKTLLDKISVKAREITPHYDGLGFRIHEFELDNYNKEPYYPKAIKEMMFSFLSTDARLSACNPEKSTSRSGPVTSPIALLIKDSAYLKKVSESFSAAFSQEVTPNYFAGGEIPLCLGSTPVVSDGMSASEVSDYIYDILSKYPLAHLQGDGVRSFLGILLYIYVDHYSAMFIDEPESFLHPPQANLMGRIIGSSDTLDRQLFISTHSKELLNGVLSSAAGRVRVVRVTRRGDDNAFALLDGDDVRELSSTTLLKYSDLVNALFHERTVLCESDSDCMFYQAIWDTERSGEASPLFLPVGGKSRFKVFATILSKLGIDYAVVPDADILRNPGDFKELLSIDGGSWESVRDDWMTVKDDLEGGENRLSAAALKAGIDEILDSCKGSQVSEKDCGRIRGLLDVKSGWDELKRHGKTALKGKPLSAYGRIEKTLADCGVYMVPVGELECFVLEVTPHGPSWAAEVFQTYPDLNDDVYSKARKFVSSWWPSNEASDCCSQK